MVLQKIREKLTGILAGVFFAVLIIPFAFVGVNSYFSADAVNNVAVVNDQEISINQFNQSFQNYRRRMQSLLGSNFDAEQFDQAIVRRQHLDSMIDQELLAQLSFEAGLSVANDRLAAAIREIPAFQVDGVFNADVYQSRLVAQGRTPRQFENDLRAQIILGQFPSTIASSAISTSWELDGYVRLQEQKRAFQAILVPAQLDDAAPRDTEAGDTEAQDSTEDGAVDEEVVLAWYEAHPDDYRSEERIVIEYLELDAATLGEDVAPDEEELKALFEDQESRFISPETRLASHILIEVDTQAPELDIESARQQAQDLAVRARDGEDFTTLARENSQDAGSAPDGGDLGWVEPGFMVQAFENALYELTPAQAISDPVQTGFGWHIIYLREVRPAEGMTFTEARPIILAEYEADRNERRFLELADRLVDIIYEDPTTLDAAAEELGLEINQAGPFGRAGGDGISGNAEVIRASFSDLVMLQSMVSDPVDLAENHLVMIRMQEYLPEALLPLNDVRDQVVKSVRTQRAMDAAQATAGEILAQVASGADLSVLGEENELEVLAVEAASRNGLEVRRDLLQDLFLMDIPGEDGPVNEVLELSDGYAVVQLQGVTDGVLSEEDVLKAQSFNRRISNATGNSEAFSFMRMLRHQSEIKVFEDRL
ncbi:MAG: SurA N-terminal domain-containing protein [Xanthomonadales bacterium]